MASSGLAFFTRSAITDGAAASEVEHKGGAALYKERIIVNLQFQYVLLCVIRLRDF